MININNLIESVKDSSNRFATLKHIYPPMADDSIQLKSGSNYCDFGMTDGTKDFILRCLLTKDKALAGRLRELSSFLSAIGEEAYGGFSFHENELLVFDDNGGYVYTDAILSEVPEGTPLAAYASDCLAANKGLEGVLEQLAGFAARHYGHRVSMGNFGRSNIFVSQSGQIVVSGFHNASRGEGADDIASIALIFTLLYLACSDSRMTGIIPDDGIPCGAECRAILVKCASAESLPEPVKQLCAEILDVGEQTDFDKAERLISLMGEASSAGVTRCGNLPAILEQCGVSQPDGPGAAAVKYEFVGQMSCMLMRAYDGERWCYLDKNGNIAIPGPFAEASDFQEGLAVVDTGEGAGVIDRDGNYIVMPVYDDVEFDLTANRLIVTSEGLSGIMSRTGEKITEIIYDQVLSEREGIYVVKRDGKYGYITRDGVRVTDIIYEDAVGFSGGVAMACLNGREYLIGTDGAVIEELIRQ